MSKLDRVRLWVWDVFTILAPPLVLYTLLVLSTVLTIAIKGAIDLFYPR
jgi:hypothetical protein